MRTFIQFFFLLFICQFKGFAQNPDESKYATMSVFVSNMDGVARVGETILFIDTKSKKKLEGTSNGKGEFEMYLPYGSEYEISIKGIGDKLEYSNVELPALKEGEAGYSMQLTIQFEPPRKYTLENLNFETGKATFQQSAYVELNELYDFMKRRTDVSIEIAGHTDNVGDDEANQLLSEKRAQAVKNYLVSKGISSSRIQAVGYGESKPVADNSTEEGRKRNRRTEVRILN